MRAHLSILLFGITLFSCKPKSSISSFNTTQIQAFYSVKDSSSISFTLLQSSLPISSDVSQFTYYFKINKRNNNKAFTDNRRTHYIYAENKLVNGTIDLPWRIYQNDTLDIYLYNNSATILTINTIIVNSKNISFEVLKKNQMLEWDAPYFDVNQFYLIKSESDSLYIKIIPYSFNNTDSIATVESLSTCTSKCQFIPSIIGQIEIYTSTDLDSILYTSPIVSTTFPKNNTPIEMLQSLKLIAPEIDIDSLISHTNGAKIELDKFWLKATNNNEIAAKNAISNYYGRIETANKLFTTKYSIGMYSDMGKCYILFGKPEMNLSSNNSDIWYYTKDTTDKSKCITFNHFNKHSDIAEVEMNEVYNIRYKQALLHWQKGKVFNLYLQ